MNKCVFNDKLKCAKLVHVRTRTRNAFQTGRAAWENVSFLTEDRTTRRRSSNLLADPACGKSLVGESRGSVTKEPTATLSLAPWCEIPRTAVVGIYQITRNWPQLVQLGQVKSMWHNRDNVIYSLAEIGLSGVLPQWHLLNQGQHYCYGWAKQLLWKRTVTMSKMMRMMVVVAVVVLVVVFLVTMIMKKRSVARKPFPNSVSWECATWTPWVPQVPVSNFKVVGFLTVLWDILLRESWIWSDSLTFYSLHTPMPTFLGFTSRLPWNSK